MIVGDLSYSPDIATGGHAPKLDMDHGEKHSRRRVPRVGASPTIASTLGVPQVWASSLRASPWCSRCGVPLVWASPVVASASGVPQVWASSFGAQPWHSHCGVPLVEASPMVASALGVPRVWASPLGAHELFTNVRTGCWRWSATSDMSQPPGL